MDSGPSASATKRAVLRVLLEEGRQSVKLVVDPDKLTASSGFPERIVHGYDEGIPLDLNPAWPLDLDLSDPDTMGVCLSFEGQVCRCRVPWGAIKTIAVGLGGVGWEHEAPEGASGERATSPPVPEQSSTGSHLRVVK
jgi:hypothetical protein